MGTPQEQISRLLGAELAPGCPNLPCHLDIAGTSHLGCCPVEADGQVRPVRNAVLFGTEPGLCQWSVLPPHLLQAGEIVEACSKVEALHIPDTSRALPDAAAGWARAVMRQRRQLDRISSELRRWVGPDLALVITDVTPEDADDDHVGHERPGTDRCCGACDDHLRVLASSLTELYTTLAGRWFDQVRGDRSREVLAAVTGDRRQVTMVLDQYRPHTDPSLDADLADAVVASHAVVRHGTRVTLRVPFGLAGFVAIHRLPGGLSEVDRDPSIPDDVLETALVLWEPDGQGPYRRWPAAVAAARLLR